MKDSCMAAALRELEAAGVRDIEQARGGKHPQLRWRVNGRPLRVYSVPGSSSDWRSAHNVRADVRRMLREDGVDTAAEPKPPPPKSPDRITALTQRVAALEQTVMQLQSRIEARARSKDAELP
jgi:hypothetical protein